MVCSGIGVCVWRFVGDLFELYVLVDVGRDCDLL